MDICMCTICMLGACRDQKRTLDPLESELQTILSHPIHPGNQALCLLQGSVVQATFLSSSSFFG